jgi:hypothetical protein
MASTAPGTHGTEPERLKPAERALLGRSRRKAFALAYAEQNQRDYAALSEAAESGRIAVEAGL